MLQDDRGDGRGCGHAHLLQAAAGAWPVGQAGPRVAVHSEGGGRVCLHRHALRPLHPMGQGNQGLRQAGDSAQRQGEGGERERERETERQRDRETERDRERQRETETETKSDRHTDTKRENSKTSIFNAQR